MPGQATTEDFAERVRKVSQNFEGNYVSNAAPPFWLIRGWEYLHGHLKNLRHVALILLFLTVLAYGNGYVEAKLTAFLAHMIDEAWKPLTHL